MKRQTLFFLSLITSMCLKIEAQSIFFNAQLSPGFTYASVADDIKSPSRAGSNNPCYTCDGVTEKVSNENASALKLGVDLAISDNVSFGTGLWLVSKGINISNRDADYYGTSQYRASYVDIPALVRIQSNELTENLSLLFSLGLIFEFKTSERLIGGDGAHYWNLAKNLTYLDPDRGQNGNGGEVALFNAYDLGFHLGTAILYSFTDQWALNAGFSYTKSFVNMINSNLLFRDNTEVSESVSIKNAVFTIDLGIRYTLN